MVLSGDTEIVRPGSHYLVLWVIAVVLRDPKYKDSRGLMHDSKDSKDLVCTRL